MNEKPPVTLQSTKSIIWRKIRKLLAVSLIFVLLPTQKVYAATTEDDSIIVFDAKKEADVTFLESVDPIPHTEEEEVMLATLIYAEACGCNESEQYRVGNVVLNRLQDTTSEFKDTLEGVIHQKGQFTSVGGKAWNRGPTEKQLEIAKNLLDGKRVLPNNVVWFSKECKYGTLYYKSDWHEYAGW